MARLRAGNNTRRCSCQSRADHRCRCYPYSTSGRRGRPVHSPIQPTGRIYDGFNSFEAHEHHLIQIDGSQSPDSTFSVVSLDDASIASGSLTSTTAELDRQRLFSPVIGTPASSEASSGFYDYPCHYDQERYVVPIQPEYQPWHTFGGGQYCCKSLCTESRQIIPLTPTVSPVDHRSSQLAGIAQSASYDDAARYIQPRIEFVSPNGPSPTSHQRYPQIPEPWSGHPLRGEDPMVLDQNLDPIPLVASPTSSNGEKGGRRIGPLTQQQRKKANAVRVKGACLRCSYMKETCDDHEDGCANCEQKKGRKWKLGCVRRKLSEQIEFLFPGTFFLPLSAHYRANVLLHFRGFCELQRKCTEKVS